MYICVIVTNRVYRLIFIYFAIKMKIKIKIK